MAGVFRHVFPDQSAVDVDLYAVGGMPVLFLNARLNVNKSLKPSVSAIARIGRPEDSSNCLALFIRMF